MVIRLSKGKQINEKAGIDKKEVGFHCQEATDCPASEVAALLWPIANSQQGAPHPGCGKASAEAAEMQGTMVGASTQQLNRVEWRCKEETRFSNKAWVN